MSCILTTGPGIGGARWFIEDYTELLETPETEYVAGFFARDEEIDVLIVTGLDAEDELHRIGTWNQREQKTIQASEPHSSEGILQANSYGSSAVVFRGDAQAWIVPATNEDRLEAYADTRYNMGRLDNKHKTTYRHDVADYDLGFMQLVDPFTGEVLLTQYFGEGRVTATWHALVSTVAGA